MPLTPTLVALRERLTPGGWPILPLRLLVGFGFASHGFAKLARGVDGFAVILSAMHVPAPGLTAWITSLLELVGGAALMAGVAVAPLCVAFTGIMVTALLGVHLRYGFSSIRLKALTPAGAEFGPVGVELNLLYIAALMTLALSTPSALSVSRWLQRRRNKRPPPTSPSSVAGDHARSRR